jgi:hypothetical protein
MNIRVVAVLEVLQRVRQKSTDDSPATLDRWVMFLFCNVLPIGYDRSGAGVCLGRPPSLVN